jgi:histidinol-phosphate aminotransferase
MTDWIDNVRRGLNAGLSSRRLRLHANESPWDPPPALKREIAAALAEVPFSRYDFALRPQLVSALSAYSGVPEKCVIPGNGADELIQLCAIALSGSGARILCTEPTFVMYSQTGAALRLPVVNIPLLEPDFSLDAQRLVSTARAGDIVFLCRPNNPTGNLFPRDQALQVLGDLDQKGAYLVVDEAYFEFCGETLAGEVAAGRRGGLVVLRTMSKAFRLAGLRLGYALASPGLADRVEGVRMPYNVSAATMVAALAVLSRPGLARRTAAALNALKAELQDGLADIPGLRPYPSRTNFILCAVPCGAAELQEAMAARGVLIRHYPGDRRLSRHVRVSVGNRRENARMLETMREALSTLPRPPASAAGQ